MPEVDRDTVDLVARCAMDLSSAARRFAADVITGGPYTTQAATLVGLALQLLAQAQAHDHADDTLPGKRTVVALCGSTRFWPELAEANVRETAAGRVVLAPGCDLKQPHELWATSGQAERLKSALDALHLFKVAVADRVLVVNPGGYIGDSTRAEIAYAHRLGKPVHYTHPPQGGDRP